MPRRAIDVVQTMCEIAGVALAPDLQGTGVPEGEISRHWIDSKKLRDSTGWEPKVSAKQGVVQMLNWVANNLPLNK